MESAQINREIIKSFEEKRIAIMKMKNPDQKILKFLLDGLSRLSTLFVNDSANWQSTLIDWSELIIDVQAKCNATLFNEYLGKYTVAFFDLLSNKTSPAALKHYIAHTWLSCLQRAISSSTWNAKFCLEEKWLYQQLLNTLLIGTADYNLQIKIVAIFKKMLPTLLEIDKNFLEDIIKNESARKLFDEIPDDVTSTFGARYFVNYNNTIVNSVLPLIAEKIYYGNNTDSPKYINTWVNFNVNDEPSISFGADQVPAIDEFELSWNKIDSLETKNSGSHYDLIIETNALFSNHTNDTEHCTVIFQFPTNEDYHTLENVIIPLIEEHIKQYMNGSIVQSDSEDTLGQFFVNRRNLLEGFLSPNHENSDCMPIITHHDPHEDQRKIGIGKKRKLYNTENKSGMKSENSQDSQARKNKLMTLKQSKLLKNCMVNTDREGVESSSTRAYPITNMIARHYEYDNDYSTDVIDYDSQNKPENVTDGPGIGPTTAILNASVTKNVSHLNEKTRQKTPKYEFFKSKQLLLSSDDTCKKSVKQKKKRNRTRKPAVEKGQTVAIVENAPIFEKTNHEITDMAMNKSITMPNAENQVKTPVPNFNEISKNDIIITPQKKQTSHPRKIIKTSKQTSERQKNDIIITPQKKQINRRTPIYNISKQTNRPKSYLNTSNTNDIIDLVTDEMETDSVIDKTLASFVTQIKNQIGGSFLKEPEQRKRIQTASSKTIAVSSISSILKLNGLNNNLNDSLNANDPKNGNFPKVNSHLINNQKSGEINQRPAENPPRPGEISRRAESNTTITETRVEITKIIKSQEITYNKLKNNQDENVQDIQGTREMPTEYSLPQNNDNDELICTYSSNSDFRIQISPLETETTQGFNNSNMLLDSCYSQAWETRKLAHQISDTWEMPNEDWNSPINSVTFVSPAQVSSVSIRSSVEQSPTIKMKTVRFEFSEESSERREISDHDTYNEVDDNAICIPRITEAAEMKKYMNKAMELFKPTTNNCNDIQKIWEKYKRRPLSVSFKKAKQELDHLNNIIKVKEKKIENIRANFLKNRKELIANSEATKKLLGSVIGDFKSAKKTEAENQKKILNEIKALQKDYTAESIRSRNATLTDYVAETCDSLKQKFCEKTDTQT